MDERDQSLLDLLQRHFPVAARPFADMGAQLRMAEAEVLARILALKQAGLLRQISAIFEARCLGYQSALIAGRVEPSRLESAAALVSSHPGVSHNYERAHAFNLWFTLAVAPGRVLEDEAAALGRAAGLERWMVLPALRTFKIEVKLDPSADALRREEPPPPKAAEDFSPLWLSESDQAAVRLLQEDLPLEPRPFLRAATALSWDEERLFDWMAEAGRTGILRRFAAILRHRQAGFTANLMGVWTVPPPRVDEVGRLFASFSAVSHCYERPSHPGWPYNLFTMVHARSGEEGHAVLSELSRLSGLSGYGALYSVREFKKERVRFFLEEAHRAALWRPISLGAPPAP